MGQTSHIIIPARLASTRLPRKLLLARDGQDPLAAHLRGGPRARRPAGICVATDHEEIFEAVRAFGGRVEMTDPQAASGTDRVAEVARRMAGVEIVVNVQGDEPEIAGSRSTWPSSFLEEQPEAVMATLATPIRSRRQLEDPACVKVVFDSAGRALYFSRSPIPRAREWDDALLAADPPHFYQHVGLYAYRREFLLELGRHAAFPPGASREAGATAGVAGRRFDPRRRGRRADLRHRHAGGLSGVCGAVAGEKKLEGRS